MGGHRKLSQSSYQILELLAQSRVEPGYFVVARRGKTASAPSMPIARSAR
jgi:hypothetical protein